MLYDTGEWSRNYHAGLCILWQLFLQHLDMINFHLPKISHMTFCYEHVTMCYDHVTYFCDYTVSCHTISTSSSTILASITSTSWRPSIAGMWLSAVILWPSCRDHVTYYSDHHTVSCGTISSSSSTWLASISSISWWPRDSNLKQEKYSGDSFISNFS